MTKDYLADTIMARLSADKILSECGLTPEELDIIKLRYSYEWYYEDIATYIGLKYRGKPYREGTVRYKLKKILNTIKDYLEHEDTP